MGSSAKNLEICYIKSFYNVNYDIISFFSPADIRSLFENFPEFKQNNTVIAAWGATTIKAIIDEKLTANIQAPTRETPSMVAAIDKFIIEINKDLRYFKYQIQFLNNLKIILE